MKFLFFDETGTLRSGFRALIFLLTFTFVAVVLGTVAQAVLAAMKIDAAQNSGLYLVVNGTLSLIPAIVIGWLSGKLLENMPFRALGAAFTRGWFRHFILGLIVGAVTLSIAVLAGIAFGGLKFELNSAEINAVITSLLASFLIFGIASAFEEALFRGYILQTFARSGLAWLAILLTSVFFGAVHLGNPNANLISTANTILAGVWFSVAYLKTRDLWFVWGLHLMWNWMQGAFFGIEVSGLTGITATPFLKEADFGPSWLTGQTYGLEGGVICTIAIVISIAAIHFLPILEPDEELLAMTAGSKEQ